MFTPSFVVLAIGFIITAYAYWCFDRALLIQYQDYHDCWVNDGKPNGLFWYPEESLIDGDHYYRTNKMYFKLLLSTPSWVSDNEKARSYINNYRLFSTVGMLFFLLGFIVFMKYK